MITFFYDCILQNRTILVRPPYPEFEKSIRIGFIKTETEMYLIDLDEEIEITSLQEIAKEAQSLLGLNFYRYIDDPKYPRYEINLPGPLLNEVESKFLKKDELYEEEFNHIVHIFKNQLLTGGDLEKIKVRHDLSLLEFLRIKRFFMFFYYFYLRKIYDLNKTNLCNLLRSITLSLDSDTLFRLLLRISSKEKIKEFMDIVTWDPSKNIVFDIQYQPFLLIKGHYLGSISIFVNSNTIRNIYSSEYKLGNPRIFEDGTYDPISDRLAKVFEYQGFKTFKGIKYFARNRGEIDFLAYKDDLLFLAECKKSLLPGNIYELRTIWDNIIKANEQLNQILEALMDLNASREISNKIGCNINKFQTIKTAIITSNRFFWGLSTLDHPVRNVHELCNMVKTGIIKGETGNYSYWEKDAFSLNDLINYLSPQEKVLNIFYESMFKREIIYKLDGFNLIFETYALNLNEIEEKFKNLSTRAH